MKASGNGAPEICVQNLLKTIRGEVPYERITGIDRTLIDSDSDLKALTAQTGDFELRASIENIT